MVTTDIMHLCKHSLLVSVLYLQMEHCSEHAPPPLPMAEVPLRKGDKPPPAPWVPPQQVAPG